MSSSGISGRVALVRTDVSEERSRSIITVTRIGELGTTPNHSTEVIGSRCVVWPFKNSRHYLLPPLLSASSVWYSILTLQFLHSISSQHDSVANVVPSSPILVTLMMEVLRSSET
jgi:hypothetical protein